MDLLKKGVQVSLLEDALVPVMVGASTIVLVAYYIVVTTASNNASTNKNAKKKKVRYAPANVLETAVKLGGSEAPWFLLDMAKKSGQHTYRLPLPLPGGVYAVGDYELVRAILQDATT